MQKIKNIPAWLAYTLLFFLISACFIWTFYLTGSSLIWSFDGIAQHYPILLQFHDLLINFITHPGHGITNWSFNIGLGANELTSYSYYVTGDLFNYLIILFPQSQLELGYGLLVLLRLYCAGLAFLCLAKRFQFKKYSLIISSITYTFSSYALYAGMHHAFFILPLIFFPLLVLGIEKAIHGESIVPLTLAVFITFLSNFYFAYILGLGCLIYVIIRSVSVRKQSWFSWKKSFLKLIGATLLGILLASVIFIPTIIYALTSTRIGNTFANGYLLYPLSYYLNLPGKVLGLGGPFTFWLIIGLSGISFLAVVYLFSHFKKYGALATGITVAFIGFLLPGFSAIFNALASPSNRWESLVLLPIGLATAIFCDHITQLTKRDLAVLASSSVVLIILIWLANGFLLKAYRHDFSEFLLLFTLVGVLFAHSVFKWKPKTLKAGVLAVVTVNLVALGLGFYSPDSSGYSNGMLKQNVAKNYVQNYYDGAEKMVKKELGNYRTTIGPRYHYFPDSRANFINADFFNASSNIPMFLGTHDIASYLTVENGFVGKLEQLIQNNQFTPNSPVMQNDYRSSITSLMGVKYMFINSDEAHRNLPFGFELMRNQNHHLLFFPGVDQLMGAKQRGTLIAKNHNAMPLMYTQNQTITTNQLEKLAATDREQSLVYAANLDKPIAGIKTLEDPNYSQKLSYRVKFDADKTLTSQKQLDKSAYAADEQSYSNQNINYINKNQLDKLFAKNKQTIDNLERKNKHGLTLLTKDQIGAKVPASLKINDPELTQNAELYLELDGIEGRNNSDAQEAQIEQNKNSLKQKFTTKLDLLDNWRKNLLTYHNGSFILTASTKGMNNAVTQLGTDELSNYLPKKQALLNLGYSTTARKQINLKFTGVDQINFKHARIIAVPFKPDYQAQIKQNQANGLSNISVKQNRVTGTSHNSEKTILTTSIPYSKGWKLTVNGKPTETQVVNQGFVGAVLPKGTNHVAFTYQTPGGHLGLFLSLATGCIGFLSIFGIRYFKKRAK